MSSFSKKDKQELISKDYNKKKSQNELLNCSFKPTLISPIIPIESEIVKLGFFARRDLFKQKRTENYIKSNKLA